MYHYYRDNPNLPTIDTWTAFLDLFLKGDGKDKGYLFSLQFALASDAQTELGKTPNSNPYSYNFGWGFPSG